WSSPRRLSRNDVVVFRSNGPNSPLHIMRVAALPGDQIEIKDERVFVSSQEWKAKSAIFNGPLPSGVEISNLEPQKIPSEHFFVLGDNRRRSYDRRLTGPIPFTDFYGKARVIYWSQQRDFPDPDDTTHYVRGPIRWNRIGTRLD